VRRASAQNLRGRVQALIAQARAIPKTVRGERISEQVQTVFQGALNLASLAYGADAPQLGPMRFMIDRATVHPGSSFHYEIAIGVLESLLAEIDAGLLGSLKLRIGGDVVADFVALAREALDEGDAGVNVAAVLVAAAFEDAIRRMGEELAGITDRPKLENVIHRLKEAGVLEGAYQRQALAQLPFRNDALHATWAKINRTGVDSALAFVDGLVRDHLS
jgi:hypothetical protein